MLTQTNDVEINANQNRKGHIQTQESVVCAT